MHKFSIYIESKKPFWSLEAIVYSILFSFCGLMVFKDKILHIESNFVDVFFFIFGICTLLVGVGFKFYNLNKIEPLYGKLEGELIFEKESITAGNEVYPINDIRKIQIFNEDYVGRMAYTSRGNFGPALSNGIHNHVIFYFESGTSKRYDFEMQDSDDFQKIRGTLIDYHLIDKIDYWELAKVLGERSTSETLALTDEIEKRRASISSNRIEKY